MDYSKTVNLPKTDFPMKADLPRREPEMLGVWEKEKVYAEALKRRLSQKGKKQFILHDGPPYANGHLHLGHALNKILKDVIVRYKTMTGHYAPYVPGWDCHGLPIELQLMKELKVTDKHKVEREEFRSQAKAFAGKFVDIQREEFKRMGVLGDWEHPYLTMAEPYKKAIVDAFIALEKKGYVYRGKKPVYWCTTDETALAEAEVEYENDKSPSIFVAFPGKWSPHKKTSSPAVPGGGPMDVVRSVNFVIWTTTPWTLPANMAIAFHPGELYVLFEGNAPESSFPPASGGEPMGPPPVAAGDDGKVGSPARRIVVAEKCLEAFTKQTGWMGKVVDRIPGSSLRGAMAQHPWIKERWVPLLPADFVDMNTGTGLVHIAPGHGMDDYQLGATHNLEVYSPVDDRGRFTEQVPLWTGLHVFKANPLIIDYLREKGALIHQQEITHSYPHCWRCHKPVIFRATEQWFLSVDHEGLRARMLKALETVEFYPGFGRNRITGMIESRPDWCLSRQRLWGTEIPTGPSAPAALPSSLPAVSGAPTLAPASDRGGEPMGPRPEAAGDDDKSKAAGNDDKRHDPDIFDVWFESGVSWAAVLKNSKEWPELAYPADMYLEGSDQHRGWFQVSLIPSVALENKAPFKSLLTHGFVMDGAGRPMSKSLGNVIAPEEIIKQYGADVLRLWVASSDYANDVRLSQEILKGVSDNYRKVRNTLRYLLNNLTDFDMAKHAVPYQELPEIDRWAMHRLQEEIREALAAYAGYQFHRVMSRLVGFCGADLSNFYLDVIKDRLYCDPAESRSRRAAQTVLYRTADALLRLLAPVLSFTADESWRFMGHRESVSLADFPAMDPALMDDKLAADWQVLLSLRALVLGEVEKARAAGRIKAPREARALIRLKGHELEGFYKKREKQLPTILSVSQVILGEDDSVNGFDIEIQKSEGVKCPRCWIYKTDVGANPAWPEVCARCAECVEESQAASSSPAVPGRGPMGSPPAAAGNDVLRETKK